MFSGIGEQCHVTRALHRPRHHTLVLRAGTNLASRFHLAAVADVAADALHILVIKDVSVVDAELAATTTETAAAAATTTVPVTRPVIVAVVTVTRPVISVARPLVVTVIRVRGRGCRSRGTL